MHYTGKKESKKEKEKNNVTKNLRQGGSKPDPPNTLGLKRGTSIHRTTSVSVANLLFKRGIYSFSIW